jgi:hypothetical protein
MTIAYSQRDVEWAEDRLGSSKDYTLGTAGCLVTCAASMLSDLTDRPVSPGELNLWLRENGGFSNGALFVFSSVSSFGVRVAEMIHCQTTPAPIKHLSEALGDGAVIIVQVDSKPGGALDQHWVRLLTIDEKDADIMDPWQYPGKEMTKLSRYFAADWTVERAIFTVAIYQRAGRNLLDLWQIPINLDEAQAELCIRPEARRRSESRTAQRTKLAKSGA